MGGAGGLERLAVGRSAGFGGSYSLGKLLAGRQVAWPNLHLPTYLCLLNLSTHIGRDFQRELLPTQWHCELANPAQVLGHCRDRKG